MAKYCSKFHALTQDCPNPQNNLTHEQIRELRVAFDHFDSTRKGYVLKPDLRKMLRIIGHNLEDKEVDIMITIVDHDKNNRIDFGEFLHLVATLETEENREVDVRSAFHSFDTQDKGFILSQDIEAALLVLLKKESCETRKDIIRHFKLNTEREVSFEEFKGMINAKW